MPSFSLYSTWHYVKISGSSMVKSKLLSFKYLKEVRVSYVHKNIFVILCIIRKYNKYNNN